MEDSNISMNPNQIVRSLGKPQQEFTRDDIIKYIIDNEIRMLNLRYTAGDGRLKALNFIISDREQLERLLTFGERVDGSSLFTSIDAASSDLYVIPRFRTAHLNPFSPVPTVELLCSFYNCEGKPLASAPEQILRAASQSLQRTTGLSFEALGELEYYLFLSPQELYPSTVRKGYHESFPFSKGEIIRLEAMQAIAQTGGKIKYGHSEVGYISTKNSCMEQHEIEFQPVPVEEAADQIVLAKWILRMVGYRHGVTISYAPKISFGHAGSGLHVHTKLVRDGENMLVKSGQITETARRLIGGYLECASSLTAFGNTVPVSYLRLVPHQEAPTNICWGDRNRSALVRVPLGWRNVENMMKDANPAEAAPCLPGGEKSQTIEFRGADGSADIHLLLAGLMVAARHGLTDEGALAKADDLYIDVNIFSPPHVFMQEKLPHLPTSCWESADALKEKRSVYEYDGVFPPLVIDDSIKRLKAFNDKGLSEELYGKEDDIKKLVDRYIHCS
ncbi:MAG: glutamine synthetase family protein [Candidatus Eremiobacteraeota bacterium]|nr:glutamine synthetase family protein [Candidatus Eremiobacteraeota bacterium]